MRVFLFIALLFTFSFGASIGVANAAASSDHLCVEHQDQEAGNAQIQADSTDQEQGQCDDCCCCFHTHSIAMIPVMGKAQLSLKSENVIALQDKLSSAELSGLKRPPRL